MNSQQIQSQLKKNIPALRWIASPIPAAGAIATITSESPAGIITITCIRDEEWAIAFHRPDGYEWAAWRDYRPLPALMPILRKHCEWFMSGQTQTSSAKSISK